MRVVGYAGAMMLALVSTVGAGCMGPPGPGKQQTPDADAAVTPTIPSVQFATSLAAANEGRFETQYKLFDQRDIIVVARVPRAMGSRVATFNVTPTGGTLYQVIHWAFASDATVGSTVPHPTMGGDLPMTVVEAPVSGDLATVIVAIPVLGTNLTRYSLVGDYRVDMTDAVSGAVWASGNFKLVGAP